MGPTGSQTSNSGSQATVAPEFASSSLSLGIGNEISSRHDLAIDDALRRQLELPAGLILSTVIASEPPPLPNNHLSRSSVFSSLAREFDTQSTVAVTGYPEAGKTIALSEYAGSSPEEVLWFSVAPSQTHPDGWVSLLSFALAKFFGAPNIQASTLSSILASTEKQAFIVIDNIQNCHDFSTLDFLRKAVEPNPNLKVLLIGTDDPEVVEALRSRSITEWRLPGLEDKQAIAMFETKLGTLSSFQCQGVEVLCQETKGHFGMLKLSFKSIESIVCENTAERFIQETRESLNGAVEALSVALVERIRSGLTQESVELCKLVSVVVTPFPQRVAKSLWTAQNNISSFTEPWNQCVIRVFESQPRSLYSLPDLYKAVLLKEQELQTGMEALHGAIADAFEDWPTQALNIFDVCAAVEHRVRSADVEKALASATLYLATSTNCESKMVPMLLMSAFDQHFANIGADDKISIDAKIRWLAARARAHVVLKLSAKVSDSLGELFIVLRDNAVDASEEASQLGIWLLLMHGASLGNVEWASWAASNARLSDNSEGKLPNPEVIVISSMISAESHDLLGYLEQLFDRLANGASNVS